MATIKQQIDELQRKGEQVKSQVAELVHGLEDNPRIKKLGKRAFFVNSRHLAESDNWTPAHHDFKYQHELILQRLRGMEPQSILDFLSKTVASGKIRRSSPGDVVNLHPDVIRQIRSIIEK